MAKRKLTIGIDVGGTNIKYGLADSSGDIIVTRQCKSPANVSPDAVMSTIVKIAQEMLFYAFVIKSDVTAIGVGTPGGINVVTGEVLGTTPNIPGWKGMKIKRNLEKAFGIPCFADNDANLFLLAESVSGAAKGFNDVVGLTVGTGIGGALLLNGEIYRGHRYVGAEIGHIPIIKDGRKCKCGLRGCLEVYANTNAIKSRYRKYPDADKSLNTKALFNIARKGDTKAEEAIDIWCEFLCTGIASVVNILNPEMVLIGGGVAESGIYLRRKIEKSLKDKVLEVNHETLKVRMAKLGNQAGWLGASILANQNL